MSLPKSKFKTSRRKIKRAKNILVRSQEMRDNLVGEVKFAFSC